MANEIKYRQAIEQLDGLITRIENDDIDVDELGRRVKEAVALLRICRAKTDKAELEVKQVVEDLARDGRESG